MTHASLFSGIGGCDIAAGMMGWDNAFHCEINGFCKSILDYWFPESESYEDITKTDFRKWRGRIDVLSGGFPCQPFSRAGKRGGDNDDRYLWPQMLRAIQEIRPTWIVGENVIGITTMVEQDGRIEMDVEEDIFSQADGVHGYRLHQPFTIERICSDIEGEGYSVQPLVIPACAVGAPHRRERVFIVGHNEVAPDSYGEGLQGASRQRVQEDEGDCSDDGLRLASGSYREAMPKRGWRDFPTQSPAIGGDDGISELLDSKAIHCKGWKKRTFSAFGNAIVPQVAYEIFRAIQTTENKYKNNGE